MKKHFSDEQSVSIPVKRTIHLHESLNNLPPEEYQLMAENQEISKSARN